MSRPAPSVRIHSRFAIFAAVALVSAFGCETGGHGDGASDADLPDGSDGSRSDGGVPDGGDRRGVPLWDGGSCSADVAELGFRVRIDDLIVDAPATLTAIDAEMDTLVIELEAGDVWEFFHGGWLDASALAAGDPVRVTADSTARDHAVYLDFGEHRVWAIFQESVGFELTEEDLTVASGPMSCISSDGCDRPHVYTVAVTHAGETTNLGPGESVRLETGSSILTVTSGGSVVWPQSEECGGFLLGKTSILIQKTSATGA